ncbi:MAG: ParA family protein [Deltaproteobacteria bacterium]|nr:ParA family protein [Deltaproteobacteria bacterium]
MIRVIFNRKGGVGKSTICCNLAAVGAVQGKKTLVIDLDPQSNSSSYLGHDGEDNVVGIAEFFKSTISYNFRNYQPDDFVRSTEYENLFVITASRALNDLESKLNSRHKIYKLKGFLEKLIDIYDEVYIDTPPMMNFYSLSALIASERCLIPFDCDVFSRDALFELLETVQEVREDHNRELEIEGIVINQFSAQARLPGEAVNELIKEQLPILQPYISSSVKIKESHRAAKPMIFMLPRHKISLEFSSLYQNLNTPRREG